MRPLHASIVLVERAINYTPYIPAARRLSVVATAGQVLAKTKQSRPLAYKQASRSGSP